MFSISIALAGGVQWRLLFRTKEKAENIFIALENGRTGTTAPPSPDTSAIEDDFGQTISVASGSLIALLFEDMDKSKLAAIQLALHSARIQLGAQKEAQSDPSFRAAATPQGPSIISPMNGGGRFPG